VKDQLGNKVTDERVLSYIQQVSLLLLVPLLFYWDV